MQRLLDNPFYYGEMLFNGELLPHCYEPIITKELFKICETIRDNRRRKPFRNREKEFLFRGIFKCAVTDKIATPYTRVKKYKNGGVAEWTYLRTWDSQNPTKEISVREDNVIIQIEDILKSLKIKDPEILRQTIDYLKGVNKGKTDEIGGEVKALKEEHTKTQKRLASLIDLVADSVLLKKNI